MGCLDHLFNYIIISYIFGLIFTFESCWSFYCTCSDVRSRQYLHLTCLFSALLHISPYNLVLGWSLSPVFFLHQLTKCIFFSSTISANNMGAVKLYIAAVISACLVVTLLHPVQLQLFIFNAQVELFRVRSLAIQISSILFIRVALPPPVYRFNWGGDCLYNIQLLHPRKYDNTTMGSNRQRLHSHLHFFVHGNKKRFSFTLKNDISQTKCNKMV